MHASVGAMSVPQRERMAIEKARRNHEKVMDHIKQCIPNITMIHDCGIRVMKHYLALSESLDEGYNFGHLGARWDEAGVRQRVDQLSDLSEGFLQRFSESWAKLD